MWKRRKRETEFLPWNRAPTYKGKMPEVEKRALDAIRMQPKHPASTYDDLPEDVQHYINRLEMEIYDAKQERLAGQVLVFSLLGVAILHVTYYGIPASRSIFGYVWGAVMLVGPWLFYRYQWNKNANEFLPNDPDAPSATDEGIREEWELNYISALRRAQTMGED